MTTRPFPAALLGHQQHRAHPTRHIVIFALGFGWLLLVVALANTMFLEFPREERSTARRKPLNLLILAVEVLCPMTFVLAYAIAIVS